MTKIYNYRYFKHYYYNYNPVDNNNHFIEFQ